MSITRSYNKHTDTYYAYDTTYIWDEKAQKKVQKKRCIGKIDPETDEVIPNGKRGRPRGSSAGHKVGTASADTEYAKILSDTRMLSGRLKAIKTSFERLSYEITQLSADFDSLISRMQSKGHM